MAAPTEIPSADDIDRLLKRYLGLLDEYTKLRTALKDLQTGVYQNIARANFSAERGVRYGQDMYDQRMQASRSLTITVVEGHPPKFRIATCESEKRGNQGAEKEGASGETDGADTDNEKKSRHKPSDPLRWFGILTPMPLRQAQGRSIQAVEHVIPRLVTLSAEMADVEIRVRRARKKRAKAELASTKQQASNDENTATEKGVPGSYRQGSNTPEEEETEASEEDAVARLQELSLTA